MYFKIVYFYMRSYYFEKRLVKRRKICFETQFKIQIRRFAIE